MLHWTESLDTSASHEILRASCSQVQIQSVSEQGISLFL